MIERTQAQNVFTTFQELRLLTDKETAQLLSLFQDTYPFAEELRYADSIHVHGRVDDVSSMPHDRIRAAGGVVENQRDGYVKYVFPGGVNMIYSAIDVAMDDFLPDKLPRPHVDHVGIDLRRETPEVKSIFDAIPAKARALGWRHVAQGNADKPVYCCHTSVSLKHWVYPDRDASFARPTEFAYGALQIHTGKMGCDLRPIDPAHPRAAEAVCGAHADEQAAPSAGAGYYDPTDLGRFSEVGKHAREAWDKFLAYYTHATAADGALTRREKSLIALAIAHSKQCPYCIDAHTQGCLQNGATVEEMHEAVHVAAALAAGIDLVHATQMHRVLRRRGAM